MIINNYFHENNSTTTVSLIKEKMLRAVVDCVICTRKAYFLRCRTLLFTFEKFIIYGAALRWLCSESLFSTLQYFIKNILTLCYSDYTTEWHTGVTANYLHSAGVLSII